MCTRSDFRASTSSNQRLRHHYVQTYCSMMDSVTIDKLDLDINVVANLFLVGNENHPMHYSVNVLANRFFVLHVYRFPLLFHCFHSGEAAKAAPNGKSLTLMQSPQVPDKQWQSWYVCLGKCQRPACMTHYCGAQSTSSYFTHLRSMREKNAVVSKFSFVYHTVLDARQLQNCNVTQQVPSNLAAEKVSELPGCGRSSTKSIQGHVRTLHEHGFLTRKMPSISCSCLFRQ